MLPIILTGIIVLIVAQNFLLVQKSGQYLRRIDSLTEALNRLTVMNPGDSVQAMEVLTLEGTSVTIEPRAESLRLLLVFATWCSACRGNMTQWNMIVGEKDLSRLEVVGLSPDPISTLKEFLSTAEVSYPVYSLSNDSTLVNKYKFISVPQTILLGPSGIVVRLWNGGLSDRGREEVLQEIKRAIEMLG